MKRALGMVIPWETFERGIKAASHEGIAEVLLKEAEERHQASGKVHVAEHVHQTAAGVTSHGLPHSREDKAGHMAMHGGAERKEHHGPGDVRTVASWS
jgi:hypothetical protein